jgi:hypothetical protein
MEEHVMPQKESQAMPTTDISFEPILNFNDPSYALSLESHDDPRNRLRHPKHRNHEGSKDAKKSNDND